MKLGTLQFLQVAAFVLIAGSTHVLAAVLGRPFLMRLEKTGGHGLRALGAISHVLAGLIYLAYAAAVVPTETVYRVGKGVGSYSEAGPMQVEGVMSSIAFFALLVFLVQFLSLRIIYSVAHRLEHWPPPGARASV